MQKLSKRWDGSTAEEKSGAFTRVGRHVFSLVHFNAGWRYWVRDCQGCDVGFDLNGYASEAEARAAIAAVRS